MFSQFPLKFSLFCIRSLSTTSHIYVVSCFVFWNIVCSFVFQFGHKYIHTKNIVELDTTKKKRFISGIRKRRRVCLKLEKVNRNLNTFSLSLFLFFYFSHKKQFVRGMLRACTQQNDILEYSKWSNECTHRLHVRHVRFIFTNACVCKEIEMFSLKDGRWSQMNHSLAQPTTYTCLF